MFMQVRRAANTWARTACSRPRIGQTGRTPPLRITPAIRTPDGPDRAAIRRTTPGEHGEHRDSGHRPPAGAAGPPRPRLRRLPDRHGLPRHHLHRPGQRPRARYGVLGPGDGLQPRRRRQHGHRARRLGLHTSLAAAFGDDHYGEYCWDALEHGEGIDLSMSRTVPGWHSPVTVSMAYEGERTMVSHGHEAPRPPGPPARPPSRPRADPVFPHCPRAPAPPSPRSPRAAPSPGWPPPPAAAR